MGLQTQFGYGFQKFSIESKYLLKVELGCFPLLLLTDGL